MFSHSQQSQIAIAYAQSTATEETTPQEFLRKIDSILDEFNPPEPSILDSFTTPKPDPSQIRL
mgnify:CR=1 FL=1|jgi:hypothetical protein